MPESYPLRIVNAAAISSAVLSVREYARQPLRVDVKAGFDAIARDTGRRHASDTFSPMG